MNGLDYGTNEVVKNFFNLVFQNGFLPLIQRPTRVTRTSATAIDHILKAQRQICEIFCKEQVLEELSSEEKF